MSEQTRTIDAVRTAIQMEIDGKEFYLKAAQVSKNALGKSLFQQLAKEEDLHRLKFEEIYKAIQENLSWPEVDITPHEGKELQTLMADESQNIAPSDTELEAVQTAMKMENRTRDFYHKQAGRASFAAEKKYYQTLEKEEAAHHASLYDYYEYMKDPSGWFTIKEKHSLDGG